MPRGNGVQPLAGAEIVYVNDGSRDVTMRLLVRLNAEDARVAVVDISVRPLEIASYVGVATVMSAFFTPPAS